MAAFSTRPVAVTASSRRATAWLHGMELLARPPLRDPRARRPADSLAPSPDAANPAAVEAAHRQASPSRPQARKSSCQRPDAPYIVKVPGLRHRQLRAASMQIPR